MKRKYCVKKVLHLQKKFRPSFKSAWVLKRVYLDLPVSKLRLENFWQLSNRSRRVTAVV